MSIAITMQLELHTNIEN